jgi:hypothetical protein
VKTVELIWRYPEDFRMVETVYYVRIASD